MRQGDAHTVSITLFEIEISNIPPAAVVSLFFVSLFIQVTMTTDCVCIVF